jgi:hypothetical protein
MGMGLFSGKKGESLFSEPLLRFFRENPLPELFSKTGSLNDDRLLAIVTALIVEDRIDAALSSFLPRYAKLADQTDFTFSTKIALCEALAQIPPAILRAATIIRKIRNEFAHNLDITSFTGIKPALIGELKNLRANVYGAVAERMREPMATLVEEYKGLAFFSIAALDTYRENMDYLAKHISNPEFIEGLYKKCAEENQAEIKAVLAGTPISIEIIDGNRIERYSKGLVNVVGGEGGGAIDLGNVLNPKLKNGS